MSDAAAVRAFPALAGLVAIRDAGWQFVHQRVVDGIPTEVDGFRLWPDGWHDAIRVRGSTDAGLYGVRLYYDRDGRYQVGVCIQRMDLTMTLDDFLTGPVLPEVPALREVEYDRLTRRHAA
jgi:hypothetical protein